MYISTREMIISIICNACGVLSLILWAIEAYKSEIKLNEIAFIRGQLMALSASEKDELQTYERGVKHAWEVAQKVFDSTLTLYEAEDVAKQMDIDWKDQMWTEAIEDEPQTERRDE